MPTELMKEFMGKVCEIMLFGQSWGCVAKIIAVEDNWIKIVEEKNKVRLLNCDMISYIRIMPEKQQEKFKNL